MVTCQMSINLFAGMISHIDNMLGKLLLSLSHPRNMLHDKCKTSNLQDEHNDLQFLLEVVELNFATVITDLRAE